MGDQSQNAIEVFAGQLALALNGVAQRLELLTQTGAQPVPLGGIGADGLPAFAPVRVPGLAAQGGIAVRQAPAQVLYMGSDG
jgi:hypothetical protein